MSPRFTSRQPGRAGAACQEPSDSWTCRRGGGGGGGLRAVQGTEGERRQRMRQHGVAGVPPSTTRPTGSAHVPITVPATTTSFHPPTHLDARRILRHQRQEPTVGVGAAAALLLGAAGGRVPGRCSSRAREGGEVGGGAAALVAAATLTTAAIPLASLPPAPLQPIFAAHTWRPFATRHPPHAVRSFQPRPPCTTSHPSYTNKVACNPTRHPSPT